MTTNNSSWDSPENEAQNSFVTWGKVGDFILGTLVGVREVESTLPDKKGQMQKVYDVKVKECSYHVIDEKKNVVEEAVVPSEGDLVSVGGRKTIDSRMARIKLGQVFGLKFTEELPAKTKSYNPTKLVKVFTPKDAKGDFQMDQEWLDSQKDEMDSYGK